LPFELAASFLLMADAPGVPRPIKLPDQLRPLVPLDSPLSEDVGRALGEWAAGSSTGGVAAGTDHAPPVPEPTDPTVRLLELADQLGVYEATEDLIAKNRDITNKNNPDFHVAWLWRQIQQAEKKLAQRSGPETELRPPETVGAKGTPSPDAEPPAADSPAPEPSQFEIPVTARIEDQG